VRQDKSILAMADQFVFLRIVRMNGVDLNLFRFDYDLTWMAFFLNADGKVYARYGGRDEDSAESRISRQGLLHAMHEVLRIHKEQRGQKLSAPQIISSRRPEDLRMLRGFGGKGANGCIHCHQVNEALIDPVWAKEDPPKDLRRASFYSFPLPESVGLQPDLVLGSRIRSVIPNSPADRAGLKKDDLLRTIQGQSVVTSFDIQDALNGVQADNRLSMVVDRAGRQLRFDLHLPPDWRRRDVSWRKSLQNAQPSLGFNGEDLSVPAKADLKVPPGDLAYHLLFVSAQGAFAKAGLKFGDVIVGVDGKRRIPYRHFRAYFALEHKPGDAIGLIYLRTGREYKTSVTWQ
jgi:hypothetical protein